MTDLVALARTPLTPVWLSHHHDDEAERCTTIGSTLVCRRCLAMFAGFVPAALLLASPWHDDLQVGDLGLVLAVAIVAAIDFARVATGRVTYSARRIWALNPAAGAVAAWLGATAIRDGFGPVHAVLGGVAASLLLVLALAPRLVPR